MDFVVDVEFAGLIPPLSDDEYKQLEENILRDGIQDPLKVWNSILIDGHNRYKIAQAHGLEFKTIDIEMDSRNDALIWIIKNQFGRRNLSAYDRSVLALKLKPIVAAKAKEKMLAGVKSEDLSQKPDEGTNQTSQDILAENDEPSQEILGGSAKRQQARKKETNYQVAQMANVSEDTIRKVEKIEEAAPAEVKAKLKSGDMSINQAYNDIKRAEKAQLQEEKRIENTAKVEQLSTPLDAQGLFQTIVIDPPWDWADEGDVNQFGRAKPEYHTMPFAEIKNLPIAKIADDNCHLYLWVTNRSLPKAFELIESWGFRYITCLTWIKPSIGMGNYFRGSTEQVLFAVKGSQPLKRHDVDTHFNAPRGDIHSAKPDEFYKIVESCSYAPFIDIFGRKKRDGWSVWGEKQCQTVFE